MKYRDFDRWVVDRIEDGSLSLVDAILSGMIMDDIYKLPYYKRNSYWKKIEQHVIDEIINPTEERRKELGNIK